MIPKNAIKKVRNEIHLEIAAGSLIAYGVFPQTSEGIQKAKETVASKDTWLAPSDLPEYYADIDSDLLMGKENDAIRTIRKTLKEFYGISSTEIETVDDTGVVEGETQIYTPADKFVDDGKEFADKIVTDLDDAIEETSNQIMDDIDAILEADKKKYEDFKKKLNRKVDHPELYPELQHIHPRYMWGQNGLYDLEFKSDIDRAIYFAGKLGGNNSPDKVAVREWLLAVTGLSVYDDYDEIKRYRKEIVDFILQLVKLDPQKGEVTIPPIYGGYYQEPEEDDEDVIDDDFLNSIRDEEDEDESVVDDSLLDSIRDEDENDVEEAKEQAETAAEVLEEADNAEQEVDLSDIPDSIREELEQVINNKKRERATPKPSSYKTNKEIFEFMKSNFLKIQGELSSINDSIQNQNNLILANTQVLVSALDTVESQDSLIVFKLDAILQAFNLQNEKAKQLADEAENAAAERALEEKRDAARTFEYVDVSGNKRTGGKGGNFILKYLRSKLTRKLYRKAPKRLRNMRRRLRKLQKAPGRLKSRATKAVTSRVGGALARRMPGQTRKAVNALNKIKGLGRVGRAAGPLKYAFAGLEYSERKQAGQSDVQALSGVGGGLAGAAAGGAAGAKGGAVLGAAIGAVFGGVGAVPGAAIGAFLGGILGGIGGGFAGSKIADTVTGAEGYEQGTKDVKPGTAILHGTELVLDKDKLNPFNDVGGAMVAATMNFVGGMGPAGASVAPLIRQMAAPLMKTFDVPNVIAQTPVGGNFPTIGPSLKKKKTKKEEKETGEFYEAHDKSFTEKLMDFLSDPITSLIDAIKSKTTRPLDPNQIDQYTGAVSGETFNPLPGGAIGSSSGQQFGASRGDRSHAGVDIIEDKLTDSRAPVVAYKTGVVTELNPNANAPGGIVGLDHGGGLQTRYVHVTPKSGLQKGDTVYGGQQLGNLHKYFSNGIEQTHLHFEIYVNNELKNPTSYIQSVENNLPAPLSDQRAKELHESKTKSLPAIDSPVGTPPPSVDLGKQNVMGKKDFGATSGVGSKGYIIIPGHATGGGAPGEKEMVKALARNAYNNIKAKNPDAKVLLMDLDEKFPDSDAGWKAQKNWYTQKESEGYEILEIHLDAKGGTGKGVIVPHRELNPVEKEFARSHGAYDRDWRSKPGEKPLAAPHRGVSMFELGNVPEKMTQSVMNYMTAPLEESVLKTMSSVSPSTSQRPKFQSLQGPDNRGGTKYLVVNQQAKPSAPPSAPGVEFVPLSTGRWRTKNEYNAKTLEKLRIGLGN